MGFHSENIIRLFKYGLSREREEKDKSCVERKPQNTNMGRISSTNLHRKQMCGCREKTSSSAEKDATIERNDSFRSPPVSWSVKWLVKVSVVVMRADTDTSSTLNRSLWSLFSEFALNSFAVFASVIHAKHDTMTGWGLSELAIRDNDDVSLDGHRMP